MNFNFLALLLALVVTAGCTTVTRIPVDRTLLRDAIEKNDADRVRVILGDKSFVDKAFTFFDEDIHKSQRYTSQQDAFEVLNLAITSKANFFGSREESISKACRGEVVQALMKAGLSPRPIDVSNASIAGCPDVVEVLIESMTSANISLSAETLIQSLDEKTKTDSIAIDNLSAWDRSLETIQQKADVKTAEKINQFRTALNDRVEGPRRRSDKLIKLVEQKFNLKFCKAPELLNVLYGRQGQSVESNCIYRLVGPLRVLQVISSGVLVSLAQPGLDVSGKVFLLKTTRRYVDNDAITGLYVKDAGVTSYESVIGALKTVNVFQDIGEIE